MRTTLHSGGRLAPSTSTVPTTLRRAPQRRDSSGHLRRVSLELGLVPHLLQSEMLMEGVLHVSSTQSAACRLEAAEWADEMLTAPSLGALAPQAPAAPARHHRSVLETLVREVDGAAMRELDSQHPGLVSFALCVATPSEGPEEQPLQPGSTLRAPTSTATSGEAQPTEAGAGRQQQGPGSSSPVARAVGGPGVQAPRVAAAGSGSGTCRPLSSLEAEELLLLEAAAVCEHAHQADAGVVGVLAASAAVQRRRRRKLLRVLRHGRKTAAALRRLAPGSSRAFA